MSLKRILAFSSSRVGQHGYLEKAAPVMERFLGNSSLNIAFIPFASVDENYEEYATMVRKGLSGLAHTLNLVQPGQAISMVERCEVIMVGGGNTFKLLHGLYNSRLIDCIRSKVSSGTPYIGWSAGSNITGATIKTTNDMPVIEPQSFNALRLFPFQINPHYYNVKIEGQNGETRDQRLIEFMMMNPAATVVGLPEGTALHLEDKELKLIGEVGGVLFMMEEGRVVKKELEVGADVSFLL